MRAIVLALAVSALGSCKPPSAPPDVPAFAPPRSYMGVALGMSQDDVVRVHGVPNYVGEGADASAPFYAVDPEIHAAPAMTGSIEEYPKWVYVGREGTLIVLYNQLPRVHALTCSTARFEKGGCSELEGVVMGDPVEAAIGVVGGQRPTAPSPDGYFTNDDTSTMYLVRQGRVIGAGIAVPGANELATAWDYSVEPE